MYPTRRAFVGTITPTIGQRSRINLINGVRTFWLSCRFRATAQVSVANATNVRNRGSVMALFDEVGILDNGTERWNLNGRLSRYISEMVAARILSSTRAANTIATYALEETVIIPFAWPFAVSPVETAFVERDPRQALEFFVNYNGAAASLFTVGGATVAITNPSVSVIQVYDENRAARPKFLPTARVIPQLVTAPAPGGSLEMSLRTTRFIRALALMSNSDVGEVNDVITNLSFRGDRREVIGPAQVPYEELIRNTELGFAGDVSAGGFGNTPTGDVYLGLNFQESGRLSNILNPQYDTNWRFLFTAGTTAAAGATRTEILCALLELEEAAGITAEARGFRV